MASGNNIIELIVTAIDQASSVLAGVGKNVKDSADKMTDSQKKASEASAGLSGALGTVAKAAAAVGIAFGVRSLFNKFFEEAGQAELATVRLNLAYENLGARTGQTRKELDDFARSVEKATTFDTEGVNAAQEVLLRFGSLTGNAFKQAQRVTVDLAAALGTDLASAANTVGRALEDPEQGMRLLRRAGVVLNDSQKELIKSLMETGQQAEAQNIILAELDKRYKGTAETVANTMTGAFAQLNIAFGNLFEGTEQSTNAFRDLAKAMTEALNDPAIRQGFNAIFEALAYMARLVGGAIEGWVLLAGAIAKALQTDTTSPELAKAYDVQSAAVRRLTQELAVLEEAKRKANGDNSRVVNVAGGTRQTNVRDQQALVDRLRKAAQDAQTGVNAAASRDPAKLSGTNAKEQERLAKIYAEAERKFAEAEAKREAARVAAIAAAKTSGEQLAIIQAGIIKINNEAREGLNIRPPTDAFKEYEAAMEGVRDAADNQREALEKSRDAARTQADTITLQYNGLIQTLEEYIATVQRIPGVDPNADDRIARAKEDIAKLKAKRDEEVEQAKKAASEISEAQKQAARNIQDAFGAAFANIDKGLKGFVRGFIDAIKTIIAQKLALEAADIFGGIFGKGGSSGGGGGIFGFLSGLFGGSGGGGGGLSKIFKGAGGGGGGGLGDIIKGGGDLIKGLFGNASGGRAKRNSLGWVGENGPELAYSGPNGMSVANMRQLAFGGGGSGSIAFSPTNSITIQGGGAGEDTGKQLQAQLEANNARQMKQMAELLYKNGFGRLR